MSQDLMRRYPALADLAGRARRRIPHFAWEFVDSGTGNDDCARRNREALAAVTLTPRFMQGEFQPEIATRLFGMDYRAPFGVAPVGMSGLIWPHTDLILAATAARHRIPYALSTAGNEPPEVIGPLADGMGWFQLYPPRNDNIRRDLLARVKNAGFSTLLVTVDVPAMSRRERQQRAGVSSGRLTPKMVWQCLLRPRWSLTTLRAGRPQLRVLENYADPGDSERFLAFVGNELNGTFGWDYLRALRDDWDGPLVLKGILDPQEAERAVAAGVDGIMVSNHGGRQFDAAPAAIDALPAIARAVGDKAKILFDSGVRGGLDIARALALGADFVLLGRGFMFAVAALGERGGDHAVALLEADLRTNMSQLGCADLGSLRERLRPAG